MKTLQVCIDDFTLYIENCVGKERRIKSDTERRKLLFHVSPAHCSFLSPAEALGTGLFNPCFSLFSLVASESADQKRLILIYTWTWMCVSQCFPLGLPFTTQETRWALCHLTERGSYFWSEKQSPSTSLHCLSAGGRGLVCVLLSFLR